MLWPIMLLVSLSSRSLRYWRPCVRKVAEQHDGYQQEKEKKSGGAVAGSLANASPALWGVGDGGQQHYRRTDRKGLGCNLVRHQGFCDPGSPACRRGPGI